jgi:hypothetical protein
MSENLTLTQVGEPDTFTEDLNAIETPQDLADHIAANPDAYHPDLVPHIKAYLDREGVENSLRDHSHGQQPVQVPAQPQQPEIVPSTLQTVRLTTNEPDEPGSYKQRLQNTAFSLV